MKTTNLNTKQMDKNQIEEFIEKLEKTLSNYQSRYTILKEKLLEEAKQPEPITNK